MPVVKKRNLQTETRLLLESPEPVELPPARIADEDVLVQFEKFKPFVTELLDELRAGTIAEPLPVMNDGSNQNRAGTDYKLHPLHSLCADSGGHSEIIVSPVNTGRRTL
jgi:hypothetical protein